MEALQALLEAIVLAPRRLISTNQVVNLHWKRNCRR